MARVKGISILLPGIPHDSEIFDVRGRQLPIEAGEPISDIIN